MNPPKDIIIPKKTYIKTLNNIELFCIDGKTENFACIYEYFVTNTNLSFTNMIKKMNIVTSKIKNKSRLDKKNIADQLNKNKLSIDDNIVDEILNIPTNDNNNSYISDTDSLKSVDLTKNIEKSKSIGTQYNISDYSNDIEWIFVEDSI